MHELGGNEVGRTVVLSQDRIIGLQYDDTRRIIMLALNDGRIIKCE